MEVFDGPVNFELSRVDCTLFLDGGAVGFPNKVFIINIYLYLLIQFFFSFESSSELLFSDSIDRSHPVVEHETTSQ